eukprot:528812_1
MRVLYLHAGKAKPNKTEIQSNEHYSRLIQQELQLTLNNDGSNQSIYSLPRGQILGLAIFDKTFWYNKAKHSQDPWATGPFCYAIKDIFRLDTGVVALGNQSIWTPAESIHQTIMKQESAKRKLKEWKTQYKNKLYIGANGIPSALTIKQPMVYGILERKKKIKNRKKSKFRLHPNKALYNPPSKPDRITCRWCPTDGSLCTNSYHISPLQLPHRLNKQSAYTILQSHPPHFALINNINNNNGSIGSYQPQYLEQPQQQRLQLPLLSHKPIVSYTTLQSHPPHFALINDTNNNNGPANLSFPPVPTSQNNNTFNICNNQQQQKPQFPNTSNNNNNNYHHYQHQP